MMTNKNTYQLQMRQILFLIMLIMLSVMLLNELSFFLSALLGAITLNILLQKPMHYLTNKKHWRKSWAALLLLSVVVILLIVLIGVLFHQVISRISGISLNAATDGIEIIQNKIEEWLGYNIIPNDLAEQVSKILAKIASELFNMTYSVFTNLVMMFFLLYFMLVGEGTYKEIIMDYLPLSSRNKKLLKEETRQMIYGNTIGIPLMMLVQGVFAYLGYLIFGVSDAFFWGLLTGLFSIVPIIGTTVIWIPLTAYLFTTADWWQGIGLLLYGSLVITNVDNMFRFILMKQIADVHPLITVFGVLIGVPMFGFWGIIFGPSLLSIFLLLIKAYRDEYLL